MVVTCADTLARLLPPGTAPVGLNPHGRSFDGERLIVLSDARHAVTHAEEELIHRRRLLDTFDVDTVAALNASSDHDEPQPPYVLLLDEPSPRHAARIRTIAAHRAALDLHPVVLGTAEGIPPIEIGADGAVTALSDEPVDANASPLTRIATFSARDLADVLALLAEVIPRPEAGFDIDDPFESDPPAPQVDELPSDDAEPADVEIPLPSGDRPAPVHLTTLGQIRVSTDAGPIRSGMRSGSYAVLALLAAHPPGRTLKQLAARVYPDADEISAIQQVRTDITTTRRVLRAATGDTGAKFVLYDVGTELYQLDPEMVDVDLWRMVIAIKEANAAADDGECLAALGRAADSYQGEFGGGQDRAWAMDYATTYRHQILGVYARIAELVEADQPDRAVAALEQAIEYDPVNEELYQRIMRIHGRQNRPDAVRRALRLLENRLFDLGEAEPSEATRRVATRQLKPAAVRGG
jgi:DNA-binding SARP family transcriptional activator